jgi:hypothetical protein
VTFRDNDNEEHVISFEDDGQNAAAAAVIALLDRIAYALEMIVEELEETRHNAKRRVE